MSVKEFYNKIRFWPTSSSLILEECKKIDKNNSLYWSAQVLLLKHSSYDLDLFEEKTSFFNDHRENWKDDIYIVLNLILILGHGDLDKLLPKESNVFESEFSPDKCKDSNLLSFYWVLQGRDQRENNPKKAYQSFVTALQHDPNNTDAIILLVYTCRRFKMQKDQDLLAVLQKTWETLKHHCPHEMIIDALRISEALKDDKAQQKWNSILHDYRPVPAKQEIPEILTPTNTSEEIHNHHSNI
jgi:hypothetical protein